MLKQSCIADTATKDFLSICKYQEPAIFRLWSLLLTTSCVLYYFYAWFCIYRCTYRTWCCGLIYLLYSFKWFSFVIMQVYYLKCSGRLGRIQNQHGRYHFSLTMLTDLCHGFLLYQVLVPEFFSWYFSNYNLLLFTVHYNLCMTVIIIIFKKMIIRLQCYLLVMLNHWRLLLQMDDFRYNWAIRNLVSHCDSNRTTIGSALNLLITSSTSTLTRFSQSC